MTSVVVDCSVMAAWAFESEATPLSALVLESLTVSEVLVPTLWAYELSSVVRAFERRRRWSRAEADRFLSFIAELPIRIDDASTQRALSETLALARRYDLTAYDASYLELALRERIPLATDDRALVRAGARAGAALLRAT